MLDYKNLPPRIIEIPEYELKIILENYFQDEFRIKEIRKAFVVLFIGLFFEFMAMTFFADTFSHYRGHLIFATAFIFWFALDSYKSWKYRKQVIAEIIIKFLAYKT